VPGLGDLLLGDRIHRDQAHASGCGTTSPFLVTRDLVVLCLGGVSWSVDLIEERFDILRWPSDHRSSIADHDRTLHQDGMLLDRFV
jgi:hypothetical protein